jgi:hypothetical protein
MLDRRDGRYRSAIWNPEQGEILGILEAIDNAASQQHFPTIPNGCLAGSHAKLRLIKNDLGPIAPV